VIGITPDAGNAGMKFPSIQFGKARHGLLRVVVHGDF
jgi:hypothetical protein